MGDPMERPETARTLVPVFHGHTGEVTVLCSALASRGLWTRIGNEDALSSHPPVTGAVGADVCLLARAEDAPEILEEIRSLRGGESGPDHATEAEKRKESLEALSFWVWACVLSVIALPIGACLGLLYLAGTDPEARRRVTTVLTVLAVLVTLLVIVLLTTGTL
jgi:hypothetical protein